MMSKAPQRQNPAPPRRLRCHIPVRLSLNTLHSLLRTTLIPQRWPACCGDARGFWRYPDVIQNPVNVMNACDAHLPPVVGTDQGEHFVDTGDHCGPQLVRWWTGFGWRLDWGSCAWGHNHWPRHLRHLRHSRHRRSQGRVRGQHAVVPMPVRARWWHQFGCSPRTTCLIRY